MKTNIIKVMAAVGLVSACSVSFADLKVGIVNVQQVFMQAAQGQSTVDQMKQELAPQVSKLNAEQAALNTAVNNFNRNVSTLSASAQAAQQKALTAQQNQFQEDVSNFHKITDQKQQQAAAAFQSSLVNAISVIAKQGQYDMILTDQTVPYYKEALDVTPQVTALMKSSNS